MATKRIYGKNAPISAETRETLDKLYGDKEPQARAIAYEVSEIGEPIDQTVLFNGAAAINAAYMLRNKLHADIDEIENDEQYIALQLYEKLYVIAKKYGHTIVEPEGSLVPLEASEDCCMMQGLSLRNVDVKLVNAKGKVLFRDFGEMLFTHVGVSGPTVLSASAHLDKTECKLLVDLKPALDEQKLDARILRDLEQYRNRSMENALVDLLPRSMIPVVL